MVQRVCKAPLYTHWQGGLRCVSMRHNRGGGRGIKHDAIPVLEWAPFTLGGGILGSTAGSGGEAAA